MFTRRWYVLALIIPGLLLGAGLIAADPGVPALITLFYALGLGILTSMDRRSAGDASQFFVTRIHDNKLSLGVNNPVEIRIESRALRPFALTALDEPPVDFAISGEITQIVTLLPRETVGLHYGVRPIQRGDYQFGDVNLRWTGALGLFVRQAVVLAKASVKVYPNIYEIRRFELLARRDQLAEMGLHNVRLRGEGTAFESLRDYTPDDPYRSINWKATARRGKPISMEYEPERSQRVVILLDVGRMMRSTIRVADGSGVWNMAKVDFVINSVLLLSYVASTRGDQVGLLVFADRVKQFVPPAPGSGHFQMLLEAMYALTSEPVEADYGRAVSYLKAHLKKRSLVVMFTDLSGARASETLLLHLPRLIPQHVPLLVTTRDPVLDEEAGQAPTSSEAVYRRAVAEGLIDERRLLLDRLRRQGIFTLDVDAAHLSIDVVNRYLALKRRALG
jgi:uncharacterized protein (DUF58 family)